MVVPGSAVGKTGLCPGCGAEIQISAENTRPYEERKRRGGGLLALRREVNTGNDNREESWRRFAAAVDLYNTRRYAEALTLLNALITQFPGNPHVETARNQCMEALQRTTLSGYTYDGAPVDDGVLNEALVKCIVLDKMLNGAAEEIQLRAADLAARMLGLYESDPLDAEAPDLEPMLSPSEPDPAPGVSEVTHGDDPVRPSTKPREATLPSPGNGDTQGPEIVVPYGWRKYRDPKSAPGLRRIHVQDPAKD